jgi:hypothetical protein
MFVLQRHAGLFHLKPFRPEALVDLVLLGGRDLVGVVVGDSHEVVQQLGQEQLGVGQHVVRL